MAGNRIVSHMFQVFFLSILLFTYVKCENTAYSSGVGTFSPLRTGAGTPYTAYEQCGKLHGAMPALAVQALLDALTMLPNMIRAADNSTEGQQTVQVLTGINDL